MRGAGFAIVLLISAALPPQVACANPPISLAGIPYGSFEIVRGRDDIDVNPDGSFAEASEIAIRVLDSRGQKAFQQVTLGYSDGLESLGVASAYTLKRDGQKIPVAHDQMLRGFGATSRPGFEDLKTVTIIFPQLEIGDQIVLTTLRRQIVPLFSDAFATREEFSRAIRADDVQITLTSPQSGLPLNIEATGMEGGEPQQFAGKNRWVWRFQNEQPIDYAVDSVVAGNDQPQIVASSFSGYEAMGKASGEHFAGKADVTPDIQSLADQLTVGISDRRQQAKAMYDWVAAHISYVDVVLGVGGFTPHAAAEVLARRYGDCKDHVMLLQALLSAKGIASKPALIAANGPYVASKIPTPFDFNHLITYVPEFQLFLDSTAHYAPFGVLPFFDADRPVVIVPSGEVLHTPNIAAEGRSVRTVVTVKFDGEGTAEGESHSSLSGDAAFAMREFLDIIPPAQEKDVFRVALGAAADASIDRGNLDSLVDPYSYSVHYRVPNAVMFPGPGAVGSGLALGDFANGLLLGPLPSSRLTTFACPSQTIDEVDEYDFPPSVRVTSVPKSEDITAEGVQFHAHYEIRNPHTVSAARTLRTDHPHAWCTPEYYARVRPELARIAASLRGQILYK